MKILRLKDDRIGVLKDANLIVDVSDAIPHRAVKSPQQVIQLHPGDVIATGTFHEGLGPINPGDILEIEIEKLGRAKFSIKGTAPRKDTEWIPGVTPMAPAGPGGLTKV